MTSVLTIDMPWPLKTYFLTKKPTWAKATSKKDKRYYVASCIIEGPVFLNVSHVIRFIWKPLLKLLPLQGRYFL